MTSIKTSIYLIVSSASWFLWAIVNYMSYGEEGGVILRFNDYGEQSVELAMFLFLGVFGLYLFYHELP